MTEDVIQGVAERVAAKFGAMAGTLAPMIEAELRGEIARAFLGGAGAAPAAPRKASAPKKSAASKTMAASLGKSFTEAAAVLPAKKDVRAMSVEGVLSVLQGQPEGLLSEEIRKRLRLPESAQRRLRRVMQRGVKEKRLRVKGTKRHTRYFAV